MPPPAPQQKKPISRKRRAQLRKQRLSNKKRRLIDSQFLSTDALFEILSHLHVEDLMRCQLVAKGFRDLISTRLESLLESHVGLVMSRRWPNALVETVRGTFERRFLDNAQLALQQPASHTTTDTKNQQNQQKEISLLTPTSPTSSAEGEEPTAKEQVPSNSSRPPSNRHFKWIYLRNVDTTSQWSLILSLMPQLESIQVVDCCIPRSLLEAAEQYRDNNNNPDTSARSNAILHMANCKYLRIMGDAFVLLLMDTVRRGGQEELDMLEVLELSHTADYHPLPLVQFFRVLMAPNLKRVNLKRSNQVPSFCLQNMKSLEELNLSGANLATQLKLCEGLKHLDVSAPRGYRSCDMKLLAGMEGLTHLDMHGNTSLKDLSHLIRKCIPQAKELKWINFKGCFAMEQDFQLKELFFKFRNLERILCDTGDFERSVKVSKQGNRTIEEWHPYDAHGLPTKTKYVVTHIRNNSTTFRFNKLK